MKGSEISTNKSSGKSKNRKIISSDLLRDSDTSTPIDSNMNNKKTLLFDLDETLIHCVEDSNYDHMVEVKIDHSKNAFYADQIKQKL